MKLCVAVAVVLSFCATWTPRADAQLDASHYADRQVPMVRMSGLLRLVETIPLPTEGTMDHLACDLARRRLFISGENNKEIVVVDLRAGKVMHLTPVDANPRRPVFDPALDELWVDLGNNTAVALDGATFAVAKTVVLAGGKDAKDRDPELTAYDPARKRLYIAVRSRTPGANPASVQIVDTRAAKLAGAIPLRGDEPAGLVFDRASGRLYLGMGDVASGETTVQVLDAATGNRIARWPIPGNLGPHVAAVDPAHHRLFLWSRGKGRTTEPGKLVVLSADTGKVVQTLDAPGGGDEIFFDASSSRIYFSGSTGTLAVYREDDPNHFRLLGKVPTGAMAKSGLWIPELRRYYAAVPKHLVVTLPAGQYGIGDWVTEDAHLMVFEQAP